MEFASAYLEDRSLFPALINKPPDKHTGIIVVVPAFSEPGICKLLDSLSSCNYPGCKVEIIIVINIPPNANFSDIDDTKHTLHNIEIWKEQRSHNFLSIHLLNIDNKSDRISGVGFARKTGMDEAVRRFNLIGRSDGLIMSLDADCKVEKNYFEAVRREMFLEKGRKACSIYFEHPLTGKDYPVDIYRSVTLYELHLRYYLQGLAFTGFPHIFHTVGSAVAVRADVYVKSGGMNTRKAGEDFYFIQKLVAAGGFFKVNSTTIFPSPRSSLRVPFGTGPTVKKIIEEGTFTFYSYNVRSFLDLKGFFSLVDDFFKCSNNTQSIIYKSFPESIRSFLTEVEWISKISEIRDNTSGIQSFRMRFFNWFNMFKVVKYMNNSHSDIYDRKVVEESAFELLKYLGVKVVSKQPSDLLAIYRSLEKQ